jgi:hypothetical protein
MQGFFEGSMQRSIAATKLLLLVGLLMIAAGLTLPGLLQDLLDAGVSHAMHTRMAPAMQPRTPGPALRGSHGALRPAHAWCARTSPLSFTHTHTHAAFVCRYVTQSCGSRTPRRRRTAGTAAAPTAAARTASCSCSCGT